MSGDTATLRFIIWQQVLQSKQWKERFFSTKSRIQNPKPWTNTANKKHRWRGGRKHCRKVISEKTTAKIQDFPIINLSSYCLTDTQHSLLAPKAYIFLPRVIFIFVDTLLDFNRFARALTLKNHFLKPGVNWECNRGECYTWTFRNIAGC